jgi:molecular chaperone GrpE
VNEKVRPQDSTGHTKPVDQQQQDEKFEEQAIEGELVNEPDTVASEASDSLVEQLREALRAAEQKAEENWNEALRARAEMDNLRKRSVRDVENAHKYGQEKLINELLPVKDSLVLGIEAAATATDIQSLRDGMDMTYRMMQTALGKMGLEEVNPEGEKFNPEFHQAMTMVDSDEVEPGTVLNVLQKGYTLNDRLVRPAMVVVARKKTEASA